MEILRSLKLETVTATFGSGSLQLWTREENSPFGHLTLLIWKNIEEGARGRRSLGPQRAAGAVKRRQQRRFDARTPADVSAQVSLITGTKNTPFKFRSPQHFLLPYQKAVKKKKVLNSVLSPTPSNELLVLMLESWSLLSRMRKANHRRIFSDYGFSVCLPLHFLPAVSMNQQSASCNLPLPWGGWIPDFNNSPSNPPTGVARALSLSLVCILRLGYNFQNSKAPRLNWKMTKARESLGWSGKHGGGRRGSGIPPLRQGFPGHRDSGLCPPLSCEAHFLIYHPMQRAAGGCNEAIHLKC